MTCLSAPLDQGSISILSIVVVSARRWCEARDAGLAVQPHLFSSLAREGCDILAPVMDSLIQLYEVVLRRPVRVGRKGAMSPDEDMLLDLLTGAKQNRLSFGDRGGMGHAFEIALKSTRIMVRRVFAIPIVS